ncbi:uncharacterized protein LOC111379526 [Olea europaea var. sylvestris]|uniref:uncharacterized protein LOC111379526 n=1 Tax=Olea europaea var. sylvestris TaxID=158386 RepID=UPI000C1D856B|nr:uncharacterized protein LOC111379526 [Olea europaea var. sylvestris]
MGNCVFKAFAEVEEMVKVVTSNGGIMELYAPIKAECITNEFPGHAIFLGPDQISPPLLHNQELHVGQLYYLLPIIKQNSGGSGSSMAAPPYRMSVDNQGTCKRLSSEPEIFPRYNSTGVWKVRLVISPDQLSEILAQEARTEALIESVRTVAKCSATGVSSGANSDQWSWKTATDSA